MNYINSNSHTVDLNLFHPGEITGVLDLWITVKQGEKPPQIILRWTDIKLT